MTQKEKDAIQYRIDYEIIVDCYDDYEVKMGWYTYMEEKMNFPFYAIADIRKRGGKKETRKVEVVELTSDEKFGDDMMVGVAIDEYVHSVPLLSLRELEADGETLEAVGDWRFWKR